MKKQDEEKKRDAAFAVFHEFFTSTNRLNLWKLATGFVEIVFCSIIFLFRENQKE
jgi:hypothetical protein